MDSCPDHHCAFAFGNSYCNRWQFANCTVRLHSILMTRKERIDLAVMVGGFCLIGYAIDVYLMIWIALGIGAVSFIVPFIGKKVVALWLLISKAMGYVMSRVLLTIVFFVVLLPVSLIYKISNKNPLDLKNASAASLFKERNHTYSAEDLKNPW